MRKISFIIIAYNIEKYIEKCIDSILRQITDDVEIIVVDDGSTDNTYDLINKKYIGNNKIKIFHQANKGANAARQFGLKKSNSEYVIFIDGDDWIGENLVKDSLEIVKNKYDIIYYNYYIAYDDYFKIQEEFKLEKSMNGYEYLSNIMEQKISHNLWNKILKRSFLEKSKFDAIIGLTMGDDLVANICLGINKPTVYYMNKCYYYYYQREKSVTKVINFKMLEIVNCLNYIENILSKNNLSIKYKEQIDYLWFKHCYFIRIVCLWKYNTEIQKNLYMNWKNKNIDINKNKYCNEYLKNQSLKIKVLNKFFNFNYDFTHILIKPLNYLFK